MITLPIQNQTVGSLVINKILKGLTLEPKEKTAIKRREGRTIAVHAHALRRRGRGIRIESRKPWIHCRRLPWHGNAPSVAAGWKPSARRCSDIVALARHCASAEKGAHPDVRHTSSRAPVRAV